MTGIRPAADARAAAVRVALAMLASCTTTSVEACAAIWEGWCAEPPSALPGMVRRVAYGAATPLYRED